MNYKSWLNSIQTFILLINNFVKPVSCFKYAYIDIYLDFIVYSGSKVGGAYIFGLNGKYLKYSIARK